MPAENNLHAVQPDKGTALTAGSPIKFSCHPGLSCFGQCCRDVNIFLTPYDVLRLKNSLGLTSDDFLGRYTLAFVPESLGLPVILLKMNEDKEKTCPFLGPQGCGVYADRPWACRMYPLDRDQEGRLFHFVINNARCLGFNEDRTRSVQEYLSEQDIMVYEATDGAFREISGGTNLPGQKILNQDITQMFYLACYNLDKFRRFVFESKFLQIFDVEKELLEKIQTDDVELMKFGFRWIKFGMLDRNALKLKKSTESRQVTP